MKTRFNTFDIICMVTELQKYVNMRVNQVYNIDDKKLLFKLGSQTEKITILLESGIRFHTTSFEWPKQMTPSGFCMKLRKHLNNKRLVSLKQVGADRIIDFQFGSGPAAYHIILELFDKGNIILTDHTLNIMHLLRPHTENEKYRFAVNELYPIDRARTLNPPPDMSSLIDLYKSGTQGDAFRKILVSHLDYGPTLTDHILLKAGLSKNYKIKNEPIIEDLERVLEQFLEAENILNNGKKNISKGYIILKKETGFSKEVESYRDFEPYLFEQYTKELYKEFDSFDAAVDQFFSSTETQKIDLKALHMEKEAIKKVERIKKDQNDRVAELHNKQIQDMKKAQFIMSNVDIVTEAINSIRQALAAQMSWSAIQNMIDEATRVNNPVSSIIKSLDLKHNKISLSLKDPYSDPDTPSEVLTVEMDLDYSAHGNAKLYFDDKKSAALKEKKTMESQAKVLKHAEKKVVKVLKDVETMATVSKARKPYWFEKFFWFISSENFLVIGGRDQQQNELIVKRYLKAGDLYVHADIHGASSVIIKNPGGGVVPPKTLHEAGTMAACYCHGWETKIVCNVWWVYHHQVSKTPPTGEYLSTGSFMIRGTKNFLPPVQLSMGIGFLFKLEEDSVARHLNERTIKNLVDELDNINLTESNEEKNIEPDLHDKAMEASFKSDESDWDKGEIKQVEQDMDLNQSKEGIYAQRLIGIEDKPDDESDEESNVNENQNENAEGKLTDDDVEQVVEDPNLDPQPVREGLEQQRDNGDITESHSPLMKNVDKVLKRGQRSKLKKINKKYKDQDDEEKSLRMSILQSAGQKKEKIKDKKNKKEKVDLKEGNPIKKPPTIIKKEPVMDDTDESTFTSDVDMLKYLTGQPDIEDELMFAVPVIAPYNALLKYKYKIKFTPGSTKRGKAAKSVIESFSRLKECTLVEKKLIKNVDEQSIARNLPGTVKLPFSSLGTKKK